MKIQNNVPSFGMSLHMANRHMMAKKLSIYVADEIERARPILEKLADDTEVIVKPFFDPPSATRIDQGDVFMSVVVKKKFESFKNPFKRILYKTNILSPSETIGTSFHILRGHVKNDLISTVLNLKNDLKISK